MDVDSSEFLKELILKFDEVKGSPNLTNDLKMAQDRIWEITNTNFEYLKKQLESKN